MERQYPITKEGTAVGTAQLERQGMFWLVKCKCGGSNGKPMRIFLICDAQRIDLGLCTIETDGWGLLSRISVKVGKTERFKFVAKALYDKQYYPVEEDCPFPMLQYLDGAKFLLKNKRAGILINDQMSISKPIGQ